MEWDQALAPVLGGILIGVSVTMMLLFNGRVTGISGIIASSLTRPKKDVFWRWAFLGGLISGGFIFHLINPSLIDNSSDRNSGVILVAGLLVGYGTVMGSGCTSGHGVCGISRLSVRSFMATFIFILFGFLTVQAMRYLTEGPL